MRSYFISDYLTHWTGKCDGRLPQNSGRDETKGFNNLKLILSDYRLLLNDAPLLRENGMSHFWMTCFTDIPHPLSREHCQRYGKFGITFKKSALIAYGANPVLYLTSGKKDDAKKIYKFICDANTDTDKITVDPDVLESLKKFFAFVQDYEHETDTYYYEREWRILQNNLECCNGDTKPGKRCIVKGEKGMAEKYYFQFSPKDVEFLICPNNDWVNKVNQLPEVNNKYPVLNYEYLVL